MTYFGFLAIFLGIPLLIMVLLTWRDLRQGISLPQSLSGAPVQITVLAHVVVAVLYTTPWDNYLVATGVWWYDPKLVVGITVGWVPIEEYTFFVLQTLLAGLWLIFLARRTPQSDGILPSQLIRYLSTAILGTVWLGSVAILVSGWQPGTYLGLILAWALPPVMVQTLFGADILWGQRRLVGLALVSMVIYLAGADYLAIASGTWTIDPQQSTGLMIGGLLPVEEFIFFLMTNLLVIFGVTLVQSRESQRRAQALRNTLYRHGGASLAVRSDQ
jgi:lycopene cyclase domain-containing protein